LLGALGAPIAVVDSPYVLNLYGSPAAARWLIDWGDSPELQEVSPTQPQVTHVYENELAQVAIRAYLLEGDEEPLDATPAAVRLAVVTPDFLIYSDDTTFPQIEGQPVGLFLTDRDALLEFQVEQARPGDIYRIIWGDGTESEDYVLVDEDDNNEVDPVRWLAGDLLELHEYYTLEKVKAILRLQTQSNAYYSNAVMFEMQSPVEIEISGWEGGSQDVVITVRRTSILPEGVNGDVLVYLAFDAAPEVGFTISGDAYEGDLTEGLVRIPNGEWESAIRLVGLTPDHGGVFVDYLGYNTQALGEKKRAAKAVGDYTTIWVMQKSGTVTEITNPVANDLLTILTAAVEGNDPIINLSITGHGSSSSADLNRQSWISVHDDKIILNKEDGTKPDIAQLMRQALAPDAQINLQGCNTASGEYSIAWRPSLVLPGRTVWGTDSAISPVTKNTVWYKWRRLTLPWPPPSKTFRNGEVIAD